MKSKNKEKHSQTGPKILYCASHLIETTNEQDKEKSRRDGLTDNFESKQNTKINDWVNATRTNNDDNAGWEIGNFVHIGILLVLTWQNEKIKYDSRWDQRWSKTQRQS